MLNQKDISYFNFQFLENKKFWKRLGGKPNFEKKTVLDFGCGHGALSIEIAQSGAKEIKGIDLENGPLDFAKKNLELNYSKFRENCAKVIEEGIRSGDFKPVDSMEHASFIIAVVDGISLQWLFDETGFDYDSTIKNASALILSSLVK